MLYLAEISCYAKTDSSFDKLVELLNILLKIKKKKQSNLQQSKLA